MYIRLRKSKNMNDYGGCVDVFAFLGLMPLPGSLTALPNLPNLPVLDLSGVSLAGGSTLQPTAGMTGG